MKSIILGFLFYVSYVSDVTARPNGSPQDACFYMTPRHIHPHTQRKVFPTKAMGLYNITTSADVYRPDRPIRVTLWGPPFKGFMMVAAEQGAKDWPTGIFYSEDGSAKRLGCLGRGDTVTHQNNSYKDSVSVLWYGPESMMSEQIQFIATVVVNLTIYYTNIKSGYLRLDPTLHVDPEAQGGGDGGVGGSVTMDPWLAGNSATVSPWYSNLGGGGTGTGGTGNSPLSSLASLLGGFGGNQGWGSKSGSSGWGTGSSSNAWGSSSGGNTNYWQQQGQGSGTPSNGNSWGNNNGWQQWGQPSGGNSWTGSGQSNYQQSQAGYQTTQSYQTAQPTGAKQTKSEIWNWNWNQGSKAAGSTPPPTTAAPQTSNQGVTEAGTGTGTAWLENPQSSSQLSTNIWAKLLDFILKQSNPKTPAA